MNALDYAYGDEPLVLFLFDPFGREILKDVIANLEASLAASPRETYIVYVYPQYEDLLQNCTVLRKIKHGGPRWQPWSQYAIYAASPAALSKDGSAEERSPSMVDSKGAVAVSEAA
jgi:hypothetical protein